MHRRAAISLCVVGVVVTLAAANGVTRSYQRQEEIVNSQRRQREDELARDNAARKLATAEARASQAREERKELERAWGGSVESADKDPDLSIAQMLQAVAQACAPAGASVSARVDRFTEFEIAVEVASDDMTEAESLCRCVIDHTRPYLSGLRVTHGGRALIDLDERDVAAGTITPVTADAPLDSPQDRQAEITPMPARGGDKPALEAILYDPDHPTVYLGGKICAEGESVGGMRVIKIAPDKVTVEWSGRAEELKLR